MVKITTYDLKTKETVVRDMTAEEIAEIENSAINEEKAYWLSNSYDNLVDNEIRKKYSVSQEFAILRQKDEKPTEYAEYYSYCEECKTYVKEQIRKAEEKGGL